MLWNHLETFRIGLNCPEMSRNPPRPLASGRVEGGTKQLNLLTEVSNPSPTPPRGPGSLRFSWVGTLSPPLQESFQQVFSPFQNHVPANPANPRYPHRLFDVPERPGLHFFRFFIDFDSLRSPEINEKPRKNLGFSIIFIFSIKLL